MIQIKADYNRRRWPRRGGSPDENVLQGRYVYPMTAPVRLIKHEVVPGCGSFEVRFADGRVSHYIYFEDLPGRRLRSDILTRDEALEQAKALGGTSRTPECAFRRR